MSSRVLPIFALLIAIAIFFAYVSPTWYGSIAAAKAAIANDNQALATADEYKAKQNELASARNIIDSADLTRLNIFLPDSVDNVGLILNLNALAARSGLALSNVDVTTNTAAADAAGAAGTVATNPVSSVEMSLSAIGTYVALQDFLRSVEKSERLIDVENITIGGSDTSVYTYQMKLRIYWLK